MRAFLAEDLRTEGFEAGAFLPGIRRQSSFATSLLQKSLPVPSVLNRNLRQQQSAPAMPTDVQAVAANFYFFRTNRPRRSENAELNFELRSLFRGYRREAIIFESSGASGFRDRAINRIVRQNVADASAQLSA